MKYAFRVRSIDDFVQLQELFPNVRVDYPTTIDELKTIVFDEFKGNAVFYLEDDNTWTWTDLETYYHTNSSNYHLWEIDTFMQTNVNNDTDVKSDEDLVNHPSHYTSGSKEVIDIAHDALTEEEFTGAMKFNIIKYTLRVGKKDDPVQEMGKVANYADYLGMHLSGNWVEGAH